MPRHLHNPPKRSDSLFRAKELHLLPGSRSSSSGSSITRGFLKDLDFPAPPKSCPAVIPPDWGKPPPQSARREVRKDYNSVLSPCIIIVEEIEDSQLASNMDEMASAKEPSDRSEELECAVQEGEPDKSDEPDVASSVVPALPNSASSTDTAFSIEYPSHISDNRRLRRETSVGRPSPFSQTFSISSCSQLFSPRFDMISTPNTAYTDVGPSRPSPYLVPSSPTCSVETFDTCDTDASKATQTTMSTITAHFDSYLQRPVIQKVPDDSSSLFKRRRLRRVLDTAKFV